MCSGLTDDDEKGRRGMQVPDLSHVSFELLEVYPAGISEGAQ